MMTFPFFPDISQTMIMQATRIFITSLRIAALLLGVALLVMACKKEKDPAPDPCANQVPPLGNLIYRTDGQYAYATSGGGRILIDMDGHITLTHDDYPNFKIEFWGIVSLPGGDINSGNHESLNGKHIKDRVGNRRTFIFPDGAKITMVAAGEAEPLISVSIYEGNEGHRIMATCNTVSESTTTGSLAAQRDNEEADGETSTIEITATGLTWANIYTENTPGNKVNEYVLLGKLVLANPNQVNDFYDDPRLGHT